MIVLPKKPTNAHIYYYHHFINTVVLRYVSAHKGLSSGSMTGTFQRHSQQLITRCSLSWILRGLGL